MSTALPLQLTLKYHDEAIAAGKKLYDKIRAYQKERRYIANIKGTEKAKETKAKKAKK